MLNAAVRSLGYYEDTPTKKCPKDGLSRDPENCSAFYSCIKGNVYSLIKLIINRKSQIYTVSDQRAVFRKTTSWSLRAQPIL